MSDVKNLNEFYSKLRTRGVRLNHQFQLHIIANIPGVDKELSDVTMWAAGASLPGRTIKASELSYMGYPLSIPSNITMTNTQELEIKCDKDMRIRNAFLKWQKVFASIVTGSELDNGGGIKSIPDSRVELYLLNENMKSIDETYVLVGAYPTVVGDVTLTNGEPEIATFNVTMQYQYWYNLTEAGI